MKGKFKRPKVLIVDDDLGVCELISLALKEKFETRYETSAKDALVILDEFHPDLITVDLMMPEVDGFSLCKQIKSVLPDVPIVIISAKEGISNKIEGVNVGAIDFIQKPFDCNKLPQKLEEALLVSRGLI